MIGRPRPRNRIVARPVIALAGIAWIAGLVAGCGSGEPPVRVGAKGFTESAVLGSAALLIAEQSGSAARFEFQEGGSGQLFDALETGALDVYAEYTGTLAAEHLAGDGIDPTDLDRLRDTLAARGIVMLPPLGFQNTYRLAVRAQTADELGLVTTSDLLDHPELRVGLTNEFYDRTDDGWRPLARVYGFNFDAPIRQLQHDAAYTALAAGAIDVMDIYSTDAKVIELDLRVLEDDRGFFPPYEALYLYHASLRERAPAFVEALERLSGRVEAELMTEFNAAVDVTGRPSVVAAADLLGRLDVRIDAAIVDAQLHSVWDEIGVATRQHLRLVGLSMLIAIGLGIPLGVLAAKSRALPSQLILGGTGVLQTIPSLALIALMIPLFGIGAVPAIVALFLYSLLPIVRNTYTGIHDIPAPLQESARALGLSARARLFRIELPLAARAILAGIKTSVVINVGTAVLGAFIGAGGYGDAILRGIRLRDTETILQGVIPAAAMAIAFQLLLDAAERLLVSRGLRSRSSS